MSSLRAIGRLGAWLACCCCGLLLSVSTPIHADNAPLFNAAGYRIDRYRSPTPETLDGVQTLDTRALQQLLAERPDTALIDVFRRPWVHGQFSNEEPHLNIPGSVWLANTGEGELTEPWLSYFVQALLQVSHGDKTHPIVVYCKADCWLSWNASRRAVALGYQRLYWYRDGIDGWQTADLPTQLATPKALP